MGVLPAVNKSSTMKTAKAMKAMKVKKQSLKVAKGPRARSMVFKGSREKTVGGLRKGDLMLNRKGKIVGKRSSAKGRLFFRHIEAWTDSVMEARRALHMRGFVPCNGKTLQGKALYVKARSLWMARQKGVAALAASLSSVTSPVKGVPTSAIANAASPARRRSSMA